MRTIVLGLACLAAAGCAEKDEQVETADVNARTALYSAKEMARRLDDLEARVAALEARPAKPSLPTLTPYPDHKPAEQRRPPR